MFKFSISTNIEGVSVAEQSNALHFREIVNGTHKNPGLLLHLCCLFFYFGGWVGNTFLLHLAILGSRPSRH